MEFLLAILLGVVLAVLAVLFLIHQGRLVKKTEHDQVIMEKDKEHAEALQTKEDEYKKSLEIKDEEHAEALQVKEDEYKNRLRKEQEAAETLLHEAITNAHKAGMEKVIRKLLGDAAGILPNHYPDGIGVGEIAHTWSEEIVFREFAGFDFKGIYQFIAMDSNRERPKLVRVHPKMKLPSIHESFCILQDAPDAFRTFPLDDHMLDQARLINKLEDENRELWYVNGIDKKTQTLLSYKDPLPQFVFYKYIREVDGRITWVDIEADLQLALDDVAKVEGQAKIHIRNMVRRQDNPEIHETETPSNQPVDHADTELEGLQDYSEPPSTAINTD
jgi:hypothetical protein